MRWPFLRVIRQSAVRPVSMVTVPDSAPAYCGETVTENFSERSCPYTTVDADHLKATLAAALVTVTRALADDDDPSQESPGKLAVRAGFPAASADAGSRQLAVCWATVLAVDTLITQRALDPAQTVTSSRYSSAGYFGARVTVARSDCSCP